MFVLTEHTTLCATRPFYFSIRQSYRIQTFKKDLGEIIILMEGKKFIYSLIDCVQRLGLGIKDRREASKGKN